jgi:hypothetical protein
MNCDGCKCLVNYPHPPPLYAIVEIHKNQHTGEINLECQYTPVGVKAMEECPCKTCLLKILCQEKCQTFYDEIDNYFSSIEMKKGTTLKKWI